MSIKEIFPNPTVRQVIFEVRYPNLLFLESRMGNLQLNIMKEFPESEAVFRRVSVATYRSTHVSSAG